MNLHEISNSPKPIVLVFGRLCSGKGTFCSNEQYQNYTHATTSDFVKKLSGKNTRGQLQHTGDLDTQIADEMVAFIKQNKATIIDGIRQKSIVARILEVFGEKQVEMIWLEVPSDIRRDRFKNRADAKDDQNFDDAEAGDSKLGLDDVEAEFKGRSKVIDHY